MATPGIVFEGVWKKYRRGEVHDSLRDLIPAFTRRLAGRRQAADELGRSEFWAIQDVSFSVGPGEAMGIIGANGAGKSTVLKTLTRIVRPTRGQCRYAGRLGALIEIAAGFHPDLTGRENIFLQGAIMGMPGDLIRRNLDAIVEFSGVDQFIDTPVKRYSSGMNARLGFAIAVHLDPDVLVIDEVLSVGDMKFQERAFERLRTLVTGGIPVVIVSHQLERVAELCTRGILLERGRVAVQGSASDCIAAYVSGRGREPSGGSRILIHSSALQGTREVHSGGGVRLRVEGEVLAGEPPLREYLVLALYSAHDGKTLSATSLDRDLSLPEAGRFEVEIEFDMNLAPGMYCVEPMVRSTSGAVPIWTGVPVMIQVLPDPRSQGVVHLNARVRRSS